jgi:hypothetical protein
MKCFLLTRAIVLGCLVGARGCPWSVNFTTSFLSSPLFFSVLVPSLRGEGVFMVFSSFTLFAALQAIALVAAQTTVASASVATTVSASSTNCANATATSACATTFSTAVSGQTVSATAAYYNAYCTNYGSYLTCLSTAPASCPTSGTTYTTAAMDCSMLFASKPLGATCSCTAGAKGGSSNSTNNSAAGTSVTARARAHS